MSLIPGWDLVTGSHWWGNFYFWASIFALISLGIMEVISHRYSERKDELTAVEQEHTKSTHENEIARLHVEAARLSAEAESLRAANLALEKLIQPRRLSSEQSRSLSVSLASFKNAKVRVESYNLDVEGEVLATQIRDALAPIFVIDDWVGSGRAEGGFVKGINVSGNDKQLVPALVAALSAAGLSHVNSDPPPPDTVEYFVTKSSRERDPKVSAAVLVGAKPPATP